MTPPIQPGQVLKLAEADYLYGVGDLALRVVTTGKTQRLPDGEWLPVKGIQLARDGTGIKERQVLVRLTFLSKRPAGSS